METAGADASAFDEDDDADVAVAPEAPVAGCDACGCFRGVFFADAADEADKDGGGTGVFRGADDEADKEADDEEEADEADEVVPADG